MPGQLKRSARCPMCNVPLAALVDETSSDGVRRKFYHSKDPQVGPKVRRRLPCVKVYQDFDIAQRERADLEVRRVA